MKHGHAVSDLHFFCDHPLDSPIADEVRRLAARSDFLFLLGDIFDFRRCKIPQAELLRRAEAFLDSLCRQNPRCRFFYVMGNHDNLTEFACILATLAAAHENFTFDPVCLRLGTILLTHGDIPIESPDQPLNRFLVEVDTRFRPLRGLCYHICVKTRLYHGPILFLLKRWAARKILRWLAGPAAPFAPSLTDVCFGHIHMPYKNHRYGGLTFHNTGSGRMLHPEGFLALELDPAALENPTGTRTLAAT